MINFGSKKEYEQQPAGYVGKTTGTGQSMQC